MKAKQISALLVACAGIILSGCGPIFYLSESEEHKTFRKQGYYLCHLESCGPQALSDAFKKFGINKTPHELGVEMQDKDRSHYRKILGYIHHDFCKITCPPELINFCKSYGFSIRKIKDLKGLTKGDVAIALLKGKSDIKDWHWATYPTHNKETIMNFFEGDTQVKNVYILHMNDQ
jgi:hypothetical protein